MKKKLILIFLMIIAMFTITPKTESSAYTVSFSGTVPDYALSTGPEYTPEHPFPVQVGDSIIVLASVNDETSALESFSFNVGAGKYSETLGLTEINNHYRTSVSPTLIFAGITEGENPFAFLNWWALDLEEHVFARCYNIIDDNQDGIITGAEYRTTDAYAFVAVVPIPGAVWLLGSGLLALVSLRKRFLE